MKRQNTILQEHRRTDSASMSNLKLLIESQERKIRDLLKTVASQAEKTNELDRLNANFVKKEELRRQEREIMSLKDSQLNILTQVQTVERQAQTGGGLGRGSGRYFMY